MHMHSTVVTVSAVAIIPNTEEYTGPKCRHPKKRPCIGTSRQEGCVLWLLLMYCCKGRFRGCDVRAASVARSPNDTFLPLRSFVDGHPHVLCWLRLVLAVKWLNVQRVGCWQWPRRVTGTTRCYQPFWPKLSTLWPIRAVHTHPHAHTSWMLFVVGVESIDLAEVLMCLMCVACGVDGFDLSFY